METKPGGGDHNDSRRDGRADDKLVGMLQVLLKALDPSELRVTGPDGGPIPASHGSLRLRPNAIATTPVTTRMNAPSPQSVLDPRRKQLNLSRDEL